MPCSRLAAAGCLVMLLGPTAGSAQAQGPPPPAVGTDRQPMKALWRLFDQHLSEPAAALQPRLRPDSLRLDPPRPDSARRFICSIVVLPAEPRIDPTFEQPLRDRTTRFTLLVASPSCR